MAEVRPVAGGKASQAAEGNVFFNWLDDTFLPTIKQRQRQNPIFLLEDLIQARVCIIFVLVLGLVILAASMFLFYTTGGDISHVFVYWLWVVGCLGVVPFTMRRATSSRGHAIVLGTLMNISIWVTSQKRTTNFRLTCVTLIAGPTATMFMLGPKAGTMAAINVFAIAVMKLMQERNGIEFVEYDKDTQDIMFLIGGACSLLFVVLIGICNNYIRGLRLHDMEHLIRQLEVAAKEAQEASDTKTRFLANMSHEIRTPLNGIIGMTEILAQSRLTSVQRKELHIISQCGQGLLNIVTDILDFSKIIADKVEIERVQFSVEDVIARCFDTMAMRAHYKTLQLSHDLSNMPQRAIWYGDPTRLQQIILNLLSNAVKFTPEFGEVFLRAGIEPKASTDPLSPKHRLIVEVADSGPGIPPDRLQMIFLPFQQADVSTTRLHGGTGLGLAITRSLCQLLGGSISVASSPQGAVFTFDVELEPGGDSGTLEPLGAVHTPKLGTVLLVDTFLKQMQAITSMLEKLGATRVLTASVEQAPAMLRENKDIQAVIVNMSTYQPEQDRWREEFLVNHVLDVDGFDFTSNTLPRVVLLRNILSNTTPLLDSHLMNRDIARRVRVAQIDSDTVLGNLASGLMQASSVIHMPPPVSSPPLIETNLEGRVTPPVGTASYASIDPSNASDDEMLNIVCVTKPLQFRHLQWALMAPMDALQSRGQDSELDNNSQRSSLADILAFRAALADEPRVMLAERGRELSEQSAGRTLGEGRNLSERGREISEQSAASVRSSRSSHGAGLLERANAAAAYAKSMTSVDLDASGTTESTPGSSVSVFSPTDARPLAKLRILVVDDNPINVTVAVRLLRTIGHEAESAVNGVDAVEVFAKHLDACRQGLLEPGVQRAFVCMLDLHMPGGLDGMATCQKMRAMAKELPDAPRLYVVAVTADALESTRHACLAGGFDDFLTKPFHLAKLKTVTRQAADSVHGRASSSGSLPAMNMNVVVADNVI